VAIDGWLVDRSAVARSHLDGVRAELRALRGTLFVCPLGELEQLYSARSARDYDGMASEIRTAFQRAEPPADVFDRALVLQRDLAHHHGMWHRTAIADMLIAETAMHNRLGVVHVDRDFDRIAEVRLLVARRLRVG
jgi:predicted nucleic acid-binding protein